MRPAAGRTGSPAFSTAALATALAAALALVYLAVVPPVPDLAAQTARARTAGAALWWTGWFGGVTTPGYSVLAPPLMAVLGVAVVGAVATVAAVALFARLVLPARRPRAGALTFAVLASANLVAGRITFAVGTALALGALVCLTGAHERRLLAGLLLAALAGLASPVAALLLGLAAAAAVLAAPGHRRHALLLGAAAAIPVLAVAVLFPEPGRMPFTAVALRPSLVASIGLVPSLYDRRARLLQVGALLSVVLVLAAYLLPSPVGSNAERLALLWGAPVVIAWSPLPALVVALIAVPLLWWPERNLRQELVRSTDASASAAYYRPLLAELQPRVAPGQRLEVVDPRTHWSAAEIATRVPLARGWERQVDSARNPLFYGRAPLDPASYRAFLDENAVAWVALPDAPLDFAGGAEGELVRRGLGYLRPVWRGEHWVLYAVDRPAPPARGALVVQRVGRSDITLARAPGVGGVTGGGPGAAVVQVRWNRWLRADGGCVARAGEWTRVVADPGRQQVRLRVSLLPGGRVCEAAAARAGS